MSQRNSSLRSRSLASSGLVGSSPKRSSSNSAAAWCSTTNGSSTTSRAEDGDIRLTNTLLHTRSTVVIPCVSERYGEKPWTKTEHRAIRELQMRIDDTRIRRSACGFSPSVSAMEMSRVSVSTRSCPISDQEGRRSGRPHRIAATADSSWRRPSSVSCRMPTGVERSHDSRQPRAVDRHSSRGRGWIVLPAGDVAMNADPTELKEQLRQIIAFVQLLGRKPWLPDRFDQRQNEAAKELRIPRLCYVNAGEHGGHRG